MNHCRKLFDAGYEPSEEGQGSTRLMSVPYEVEVDAGWHIKAMSVEYGPEGSVACSSKIVSSAIVAVVVVIAGSAAVSVWADLINVSKSHPSLSSLGEMIPLSLRSSWPCDAQ
jgi:hypothetical protein